MTQAFCNLILHYSSASLSWRTIKSLRRSRRSRLRGNQKKCKEGDDGNDESHPKNVEYEILKGWTILAFHSLYVSIGVEYFITFVIPFYFHLKMVVLIATFVIPSRGDGITSEYGLSPVISYWFDYLIVPAVHRVHELMDHDPKGWAMQQLAIMPFLVLDYFILPGLLTTEEEKQRVRESRRIDRINHSEEDTSKVPPSETFPPLIANAGKTSPDECLDQRTSLPEKQSALEEIKKSSQSTTQDQECRNQRVEQKRLAAEQPDASECIHRTPPRSQKTSSLFGESTPNLTQTPLWATPTVTLPTSLASSKKSFNSILSPTVRSRLASSAMRLRRFSRDHRKSGDLLSPRSIPRRGEGTLDGDDEKEATAKATIKEIMESPLKQTWHDENDGKQASSRVNRRRKRHQRLSLGDHFREIVTGDANIRVRDHLFDLDLPVSPRRVVHMQTEKGLVKEQAKRPGSGSSRRRTARSRDVDEQFGRKGSDKIASSNISTRRSSRLAKRSI